MQAAPQCALRGSAGRPRIAAKTDRLRARMTVLPPARQSSVFCY